jgi:hypothetical protein
MYYFRFYRLEINNVFNNIFIRHSQLRRIIDSAHSFGLKLEGRFCANRANIGIPGIQILKKCYEEDYDSGFAMDWNYEGSDDSYKSDSDKSDSDGSDSDNSDSDNSDSDDSDSEFNLQISKVRRRLNRQYNFFSDIFSDFPGLGGDILIASDGIAQNLPINGSKKERWCTAIMDELKSSEYFKNATFEASDPETITFLIERYGTDINLLVDHTHVYLVHDLRR